MKKIKFYEYEKCSTCRNAAKFLEQNKISYERIPIVEQPPSLSELSQMLEIQGGEIKKIFNTSGVLYREMKLGEKIKDMSPKEALLLLSTHGKLVKRPFVLTEKGGLLGFKQEEWSRHFDV